MTRRLDSHTPGNWAQVMALVGGLLATNTADAAPSKLECTEAHPNLCSPSACVEKAHQKFPDAKDAKTRDNWIAAHCEGEEKPECSDGTDNKDPEDTLADMDDPACHPSDGNPKNPNSYDPNHNSERDPRKPLSDEQRAAKEARELEKAAKRQADIERRMCEIDPNLPDCQELKEGPAPVQRNAEAKVVTMNSSVTEKGVEAATKRALDSRLRCALSLGVNLSVGGVFPGQNSDKRHGQILDYSFDPGAQCKHVRFGGSLGVAHIWNGNDPSYTNGPRQARNAFFMPGAWVEGDLAPIGKAQWFRLNPGVKVAGMFGGPSNNTDVAQDEGSARGAIIRPYVNVDFKVIDKKKDDGEQVFRLDAIAGGYIGGVLMNVVNGDHIAGGDSERDNKTEQNFGGLNGGINLGVKAAF